MHRIGIQKSSWAGGLAVAGVAAVLMSFDATPSSQAPAPAAAPQPRTIAGKPNFNGIWQAMNTADWDLVAHHPYGGPPQVAAYGAAPAGLGVVEGNEIPYRPEAAKKKAENFAKRWTEDPAIKCYMPGIPRATYQPFPFQIIQGTNKIMMVYEFASANRTVHLDKVAPPPVDTWMGHSVGRWDGTTLVVDVTGFNDQSWFDRAGDFHSDALHVVERFTMRDQDHLQYEATIEDKNVFTRPWKISMPLYRRLDPNMQLLEFKCVEFAEELLYGRLRRKTN